MAYTTTATTTTTKTTTKAAGDNEYSFYYSPQPIVLRNDSSVTQVRTAVGYPGITVGFGYPGYLYPG